MRPNANKIENETSEWYRKYYAERGENRNDLLSNPSVLFQDLAQRKALAKSLMKMNLERKLCTVLDVGCGGGGSLVPLLQWGFDGSRMYGIDIVEERILEGKRKFPNLNLANGDASKMVYEDEFFDLVMESTMFIQLTDSVISEKISSEMIRVTKSNGFILLIDWRYDFWKSEYLGLSNRRIKKLFKVGELTELFSRVRGQLIPPIGRNLSKHFSSVYFLVQRIMPFLSGLIVTVLKKKE
jgi:ubiquinone/menaquinone biosynthesis C-methylase UbiE